MHLILLRHCTRIDKFQQGNTSSPNSSELDSSSWLANFDPPLEPQIACNEMETAFKKISSNLSSQKTNKYPNVIIHSSPYNRCIQTTELLLSHLESSKLLGNNSLTGTTKLRIDHALSEWLSENFNLHYLPPNDDGYSMISNVNTYLSQTPDGDNSVFTDSTRENLRTVRDQSWMHNKLGHAGDYGESSQEFKLRCFQYLTLLLQFYYQKQTFEQDKHTTIVIISHGAVISTLLQLILNRPIFSEIPLCTPIYLKQSLYKRSEFNLMDYDFNLSKILSPSSDRELLRIINTPLDMTLLDFERYENDAQITIGDSNFATIIQSPPRSRSSSFVKRKRSNTVDLGRNDIDSDDEMERVALRQTRSSKQLHLLNENDRKGRQLDMNKLHSYFSGFSDSDSEDTDGESEHAFNENIITTSIPSLASLNYNKKSFESFVSRYSNADVSEKRANSFVLLDKLANINQKENLFDSPQQQYSRYDCLEINTSESYDSDTASSVEDNFLFFKRPNTENDTRRVLEIISDVNSTNETNQLDNIGLFEGTFSKTQFGSRDRLSDSKQEIVNPNNSFLKSLGLSESDEDHITIISTMTNSRKKTRNATRRDNANADDKHSDENNNLQPELEIASAKFPKVSPLYMENNKGNTNAPDKSSLSSLSSFRSSSSRSKEKVESLKNILFNNGSLMSSDEDSNWFGGNFQSTKV